MTRPVPLAVSAGDHAGIGPRVTLLALAARPKLTALVFGDAERLFAEAERLGVDASRVVVAEPDRTSYDDGTIALVDVGPISASAVAVHAPTPQCGQHQLRALDAAVATVRAGRAKALVTGPVSKEAIAMRADPKFVGQTEHLARAAGLADDAVTMMFLGPKLRIALVTTHVAVARAPSQITEARVVRTGVHLAEALLRLHVPGERAPIVEVGGLNPHLGEHDMFGEEDDRVIAPAVARMREAPPYSTGAATLRGLRSAEAVLRAAASGEIDGVVAMLHDQATIPSKLLDWGAAVNVTWGLPFVRTSVDHGVAYDAASRDEGNADGMIAALDMAERLAP